MNKKDKNIIFQGSDWKDYSDFEFKWIEIILTKDVLKREDLLFLLNKFGIKFSKKNWEDSVDTEEMGNVLINDVPKGELWSEVVDILSKRYADKLSFDEAYEIWERLDSYRAGDLLDIYKKISTNKNIDNFVSDKRFFENEKVLSDFLKLFIIEELCKISKKEAIKSLEK